MKTKRLTQTVFVTLQANLVAKANSNDQSKVHLNNATVTRTQRMLGWPTVA